MTKDGKKTGGRKVGTPNKATAAKAALVEASGLTPLDFMLDVLRDTARPFDVRMDAAKAAAPYIHPKFSTVQMTGASGGPIETITRIELVDGDGTD